MRSIISNISIQLEISTLEWIRVSIYHELLSLSLNNTSIYDFIKGKIVSWLVCCSVLMLYIREMNECIRYAYSQEKLILEPSEFSTEYLLQEFDYWLSPKCVSGSYSNPGNGLLTHEAYYSNESHILPFIIKINWL